MKNLHFALIITVFACFQSVQGFSKGRTKTKSDSLVCLHIQGKITNIDDGSDEDCIIELISSAGDIDTILLSEGRSKFKFLLEKNTQYGIRISKPGYLPKLVCVNTELLVQTENIYKFLFETRLIKETAAKRLNRDVIDFPIALVAFDYDKDGFFHSEEYTKSIKRELLKPNPSTELVKTPYVSKSLASN